MGDTEQLRARIEAQVAAKRLKAAQTDGRPGHRAAPVDEPPSPAIAPPPVASPVVVVNGNGSSAHTPTVSPLPPVSTRSESSDAEASGEQSRVYDVADHLRAEWATAAAREAELARQSEIETARRESEQQVELARLAAAVRDAETALRVEADRRADSERRLAELEQRLAAIETARTAALPPPVATPTVEPFVPPPTAQLPAPAIAPVAPSHQPPPVVDQPRKRAELSAATAARWPAISTPEVQPEVESEAAVVAPVSGSTDRAVEYPAGVDMTPPVARHAVALPSTVRPSGETPHTRRTGRLVLRLAVMVVVAALAAVLLRTFVIASYYIPSASMEPTLHGCTGCNNDHVLVNKLAYHLHAVHRGDVVVFHRPVGAPTNEKVLIKRVIGLPGDVLTDRNDVIYVDGRPLHEPYLNPACSGTQNFPAAPVTVPKGEVYVMGDNRCDSSDSRVFGPITEASIIGRAFVIVWPLGRIHYL